MLLYPFWPFEPLVLLVALPLIFGIGMILFTNNTCDIEKDIEAQRKTISVVLGRETAPNCYHVAILVWIAAYRRAYWLRLPNWDAIRNDYGFSDIPRIASYFE